MKLALRLIVGLGNPGPKYAKTRHNVGAWLLAELALKQGLNFHSEPKFSGQIASLTGSDQQPCWLLIPTTFINESGRAVQALSNFYKISPQEILVAHDELDFPTGIVRIKQGGGHGGHNGLRNIIQQLGSSDFYRLRIGIDHPGNRDQVTPYVLSEPPVSEKNKIVQAIDDSLAVLPDLIAGEFDRAFRFLHNTK
ncbi:MAG: aminoacyl-tRNA hydrolase [Proteobacteria bacterium]|nr:aminoacyl-tRNA hydrolase [Pseudomonadota bacterium]